MNYENSGDQHNRLRAAGAGLNPTPGLPAGYEYGQHLAEIGYSERPRQSPESLDPRTPPPPPQPTMIESATGRLQASIAELLGLKDRLSATCDRLLGPVPAATQAVGATGDMHCNMQWLHTSLDLLESGLGELRSQVERVERL